MANDRGQRAHGHLRLTQTALFPVRGSLSSFVVSIDDSNAHVQGRTMSTKWTGTRELEQPRINAALVKFVLALAWKHA